MAQAAAKKSKTATFVWEGVNRAGKKITGEVEGTGVSQVNAELRRKGINPKKVKKKSKPLLGGGGGKIVQKDIAIFSRQVATMLGAGLPIVQALEIVAKGNDNPAMRKLVGEVKADIESGTNLTDALAAHPLHFDDLYCNLVAAGEQAGILESLLEKIATYKEKTEALKGKIKSAMGYPIAVVIVAFIITAILLIFVIPQFESLFSNFGADLPGLTLMVVAMSKVFTQWWWAIFGGIGGTIGFLSYSYKRSKKMQEAMDRFLLKAPVIGNIVTKAIIARWTRTLATMFAAGVPLLDALDNVAGAAGNSVYYKGTKEIQSEVATGTQLQIAMETADLFPNMVVQMVAIGEESGELDGMLTKIADIYEGEVDDAVDGLTSLMEPIIMSFLGVVVGGMVVAMYLPIFKMASVV